MSAKTILTTVGDHVDGSVLRAARLADRAMGDEQARMRDVEPTCGAQTLAIMHDGAEVSTIEDIATDSALHPLQEAFIRQIVRSENGTQCRYLVIAPGTASRYGAPVQAQSTPVSK
jgi:aerobic-type carbon monoxide dehydrogenase small subunit (CoxS/CutS family)